MVGGGIYEPKAPSQRRDGDGPDAEIDRGGDPCRLHPRGPSVRAGARLIVTGTTLHVLAVVFLAIVLVSPGGVVGALSWATAWVRRRLFHDGTRVPEPPTSAAALA